MAQTKTANIATSPREIAFVSRFAKNYKGLLTLMGVTRSIEKVPGTVLKVKTASIVLESGDVAEGVEVTPSTASVTEKIIGEMKLQKYAKETTIEAIADHGYEDAVALTDKAMIDAIIGKIKKKYVDFIKTGTLTMTATTFQSALAAARGAVINEFGKMEKDVTEVVGFANIMDAYAYLGAAGITTQNAFGMTYVENFLGYRTLFLMSDSEMERSKVIALPVENIISYKINPANGAFQRADLRYTTDGITNLIGVHTEGKYGNVTTRANAIYGLTLMVEYLNGIAVVTIATGSSNSIYLDKSTGTVAVGSTLSLTATKYPSNATVTWTSSDTSVATVANGTVTGVKAGTAKIQAAITVDGLTYTALCEVEVTPAGA